MKQVCAATTVLLAALVAMPLFADNRELAAEVMEIHDVAMARMTEMHELKLQLQAQEKASGATPETTAAIAALEEAHDGMMGWMRQYKPPQTEAELAGALDYLEAEKVKIRKVSDDIDSSIEQAEKLLE